MENLHPTIIKELLLHGFVLGRCDERTSTTETNTRHKFHLESPLQNCFADGQKKSSSFYNF